MTSPSSFFIQTSTTKGQFDFNAEAYASEQIKMANRLEDMTGVAFWGTKGNFAKYD